MKAMITYLKVSAVWAAGLVLAASLCLAGCAGSPAAGSNDKGELRKEEMGRICLYRPEKDENYDADMKIVEGRVDAFTGGRYILEETTLESGDDHLPAVEIYVPKELYGERSLRDLYKILLSRPGNLWLGNDSGSDAQKRYKETTELPRSAIKTVEILHGCPESVNPLDYGMEAKDVNYLKITLTEEYIAQNPQIWEWQHPGILQDFDGYDASAYYTVAADQENSCIYWLEEEDQVNYCQGLYYTYTHEPLTDAFYIWALPFVEWESADEIRGAGQIENSGFETATVINAYEPEQQYVSDENWQQALTSIRERMDASGLPYAIGRLPDNDRSVVIRLEEGPFADEFMDFVVQSTSIELKTRGLRIGEDISEVKLSAEEKNGQQVLTADMSEAKKDTINKLSYACEKSGGGRIILSVNETPMAYGYCDKAIRDGKIVLDHNAVSGEAGFGNEMAWFPGFLEVLINGTPFPMLNSYSPAVALGITEAAYLTEDNRFYIPESHRFSRDVILGEITAKAGDLPVKDVSLTKDGLLSMSFAVPEGDTRNEKIAETASSAFKRLKEEIFTYGIVLDFLDESGKPALRFSPYIPQNGDPQKFQFFILYRGMFSETDARELRNMLGNDQSLAGFVDAEEM